MFTPSSMNAAVLSTKPHARCAALALLGALAATLWAPPSWAAEAAVQSELKAWRVVKAANGQERLEAARQVSPGDVIQYTAVYTNASRQTVRGLVASLPIPTGTEVLDAAALPADVLASVDGKNFAALPLMRKVRQPNGQVHDEPVPTAEYRYLRWSERPLAAAASYSTGVRVRVVASATPVR